MGFYRELVGGAKACSPKMEQPLSLSVPRQLNIENPSPATNSKLRVLYITTVFTKVQRAQYYWQLARSFAASCAAPGKYPATLDNNEHRVLRQVADLATTQLIRSALPARVRAVFKRPSYRGALYTTRC